MYRLTIVSKRERMFLQCLIHVVLVRAPMRRKRHALSRVTGRNPNTQRLYKVMPRGVDTNTSPHYDDRVLSDPSSLKRFFERTT